ncbi:MAG: insulinase family protein [Desulfohalobiaceae bacterium]|nr:insulinase family protein [Desulfohalobiaceae bacterium]
MTRRLLLCIGILILAVWGQPVLAGSYLQAFEDKVTAFSLENGLRFLVIERHQAPVVSFVTFVNVGSVDEPRGQTGIAHLFEHLAFKGTPNIGTSNWEREQTLLDRVDAAYTQWLQAKYRDQTDEAQLTTLRDRFETLRTEARQFVVPNAFAKIIEKNGGTDLNAATARDYTMYFCSLPANRIELWFSLESDRLLHPVFREFYTEKQVVLEERRMRVDSNPTGRLIEELLTQAYQAHPYRTPTLGWTTDIIATTRADLRSFYEQYYRPGNLTVAIAGDVDPERIKTLARTYFGSMKTRETTLPIITREPSQRGERQFTHRGPNQPVYLEAYHTVAQSHPDSPTLDILSDILSRGRVSRLYRSLVDDAGLAQHIQTFNGFPGDQYPGLFVVYAVSRQNAEVNELVAALHTELTRIKKQGISQEELERAKTRLRADLVRNLRSNLGLARRLARAEAQEGGWRQPFTYLDRLQRIDPAMIRRVANDYLLRENRTAGRMLHQAQPGDESGRGE